MVSKSHRKRALDAPEASVQTAPENAQIKPQEPPPEPPSSDEDDSAGD